MPYTLNSQHPKPLSADNSVRGYAGLCDRHAEQQHQAASQQQLAFPDHDSFQSCRAEDNLDATKAGMCWTSG